MTKKFKVISGLIALLLIAVFLQAQYHVIHRSNRYWKNDGIFSTDNRIQSMGVNNKLRLAYSGGIYADMVSNDEGEFELEKTITLAGEGYSTMVFDTTWSGQDEARQGIINIWGERDTAITSWGGSPEMGIKMTLRNEVAHGVGTYHLRGVEVVIENRGPGTMGDIVCAYFSAGSQSGSQSSSIRPLWVIYDQSGGVNTEHTGIYIQDNSQSQVGTNYGIKLVTTNYNLVREYGYFLDSLNGSWTNGMSFNGTITNVFDFEGTAGTSGAGYNAGYTNPSGYAVPDGYIKVDIGGNTQYIYTWTTIPS